MKKIHRVIVQEITPPALIALLILTFVVFTREFGRLTEMLIRKNADALTVLKVVVAILPSILIFTVPIAFLVGTLVGFARLSTESEVVAMRAGGIGVYQILTPVFLISLGVAALTAVLTLFLLPVGNWTLKVTRHEIGLRPVQSYVRPRVFNEDLPGRLLYVEDIDLATRTWKGVFLSDQDSGGQERIVLAREGQILVNENARRLQLFFGSGSSYEFNRSNPTQYRLTHFRTLDVTDDLPDTQPPTDRPKSPADKVPRELWTDLNSVQPKVRYEALVELNRRVALPLSALIFAILGVTFGITSHKGGRGYGSIMSMVIAFTYYILFATGSRMANQEAVSIWAGVWGANILFGLTALASLRLTRRGLTVFNILGHHSLPALLLRTGRRFVGLGGKHLAQLLSRLGAFFWSLSSLRLRITRVVDLYLVRSFFLNLLAAALTCIALFYLFTFFELLDDLVASGAGYPILLQYFIHLLPHVLMLLVPISVLIATLVTFGTLEKTAQVTAFKSCGISVYRLALPVIAVAGLICVSIFVLQDYVLPYANQRQDNLRNLIKGRPIQTFYQPGHNWIFGKDNRLFNYNYFDSKRGLFGELSIYEMNIRENQLIRHLYAQRARWDEVAWKWNLYDGWSRDLQRESEGYTTFDELEVALPETPDYFVQEVKESSKMTYIELDQYVQELQQQGFEVDHLKTELYTKVSFPLVSFVMVVLGIPFAFSVGKKGALYGVAAGALIGIVYWGTFGVFGVLGGSGLLSPLLAAWGPNLIFGSGSLFLFLGVKT